MASRQYERAQDVATDAIQETGDAIQRNPLTAIGIGLGVGFLFGRAMGAPPLSRQGSITYCERPASGVRTCHAH